ncbi:MAG: hypothetical protein RLZZ511_3848 [Cyanobacteriota bacterium]
MASDLPRSNQTPTSTSRVDSTDDPTLRQARQCLESIRQAIHQTERASRAIDQHLQAMEQRQASSTLGQRPESTPERPPGNKRPAIEPPKASTKPESDMEL